MRNTIETTLTAAFAAVATTAWCGLYPASTSFEKWSNPEQAVTTGIADNGLPASEGNPSYWTFIGEDTNNFSAVVAEDMSAYSGLRPAAVADFDDDDRTNAAKVLSFATLDDSALLRALGDESGNPAEGAVFIDTLVQFTAHDDPVAIPVGEDGIPTEKIMLYLKHNGSFDYSLYIAASKVSEDGFWGGTPVFTPVWEEVSNSELGSVQPDTWYRLTISATIFESSFAVFNVSINGKPLSCKSYLLNADRTKVTFPSLQGAKESESAVFSQLCLSGKGKLDDFTVSSYAESATLFDFTLYCGAHVSAVQWTVGGSTYQSTRSSDATASIAPSDVVRIDGVSYDDGYMPSGEYKRGWSGSGYAAATAITVGSAEVPSSGKVPGGTTPADLAITNAAFAEYTEYGQLPVLLGWKKRHGVSVASVNENMAFVAGAPDSELAEAYLLNCAPAELEEAKAAFKFTSLPPTAEQFEDAGYNGNVNIEGAESLDSPEWSTSTPGPFNRATLTLRNEQ